MCTGARGWGWSLWVNSHVLPSLQHVSFYLLVVAMASTAFQMRRRPVRSHRLRVEKVDLGVIQMGQRRVTFTGIERRAHPLPHNPGVTGKNHVATSGCTLVDNVARPQSMCRVSRAVNVSRAGRTSLTHKVSTSSSRSPRGGNPSACWWWRRGGSGAPCPSQRGTRCSRRRARCRRAFPQ